MAADKITYNVRGIAALANGSRELDAAKARIEQLLLRQGEHVAQELRAQLARELKRHRGAPQLFIAQVLEWLGSRDTAMHTYSEVLELAIMSARNARLASTKQVAQELWKIAQEYQAEAAKLGEMPDIGEPPQAVGSD